MSSANQLQRLPLEKNLFWTGTLALNDQGGHVFFDVRVKKNVPGQHNQIGLFTSDIPPFPLNPTDNLNIAFILENNQGITASRYTICEASLSGSELAAVVENNPEDTAVVQTPAGEWHFLRLEKTWVVKAVMIYAQLALLKQHVKDL